MKVNAKSFKAFIRKEMPTILCCTASVTAGGAVIFAIKDTPKALKFIENRNEEESYINDDGDEVAPDLTPKEYIYIGWKFYKKSILCLTATIFLIFEANHISARRLAASIEALRIANYAYKDYRKAAEEKLGEDKARTVKDIIARNHAEENPPKETDVNNVPDGKVLCYEPLTGRYFYSTAEEIKAAINETNAALMNQMYISLGSFFDRIGLSGTELSEDLGWRFDGGLIEIMISSNLTDGPNEQPCLSLIYATPPTYGFEDFDR